MRLPAKLRVSAFLGLAILAGSLALAAPAKKKKATDTPAPEPMVSTSATASVRLWKEEFPSRKPLRVELQPKSNKATALRFEPPAAGSYFTEYAACAPGSATLTVLRDESEKEKPQRLPVMLTAGSFTTLLLRERDGAAVIEVIDDVPAGTDAASGELTVRNFAPALVEIRVQAGDSFNARMRAPTAFLNIRGLDRRRCQIDTVTKAADGKESRWSTEIDFRACPKGTLLVYSDPYGRIRPRIVPDGQPPFGNPATAVGR